ncbi:MAG: C69 family dipeptidase [Bacteroidales bacterium]|jgi:dipeptidase|nr:C69 family dipeptidase [Bacteroidales bacterium]
MKKLLLILSLSLLAFNLADACTNFLITKGASADGSTMITYAADSHVLYGELYYRPAADYEEGTWCDITEWDTGKKLGKIKQITHTYSVVGNINEYAVSIGETTYTGLEELQDTTGIIDYGSLMYIALQRAKTAREAIKVIAELTAEYGYCSTGESFSIADPNEVWIMEVIGKGKPYFDKKGNLDKNYTKGMVWVALRIPDGYICGHANQARITTFPKADGKKSITSKQLDKIFNPEVECVYAYDVASYAKGIGIYNGKDEVGFDFSGTYNPINFHGARFCDARVWAMFNRTNHEDVKQYEGYARGEENLAQRMPLWIRPDRLLTVNEVMGFMRDHYEGTSMDMSQDVGAGPFNLPYRWRPMEWKYNDKTYIHERATSTQQTGFSFVAQMQSKLPRQIGGILWFGVDDTYSTCYMPMYCGITQIPTCVREGNGNMAEFSPTSAFWLFNRVTNFAYLRYADMIKDIRKVQNELETNFVKQSIDNGKAWASKDELELVMLANRYSNDQAYYTFKRWQELDQYLLVKYIDGNIKKEENGKFKTTEYGKDRIDFPMQPRYPDSFYKQIVDQKGTELEEK